MALKGPAQVGQPLGAVEGHSFTRVEICVKSWQALTVLEGFWSISPDLSSLRDGRPGQAKTPVSALCHQTPPAGFEPATGCLEGMAKF
jgi:hypothetical protein